MPKLKVAQIESALSRVPGWNRKSAVISRVFQFEDFPAAIKFVNKVAVLSERAWYHPDIDIRRNKVTLTLTTHDQGGQTGKDLVLHGIPGMRPKACAELRIPYLPRVRRHGRRFCESDSVQRPEAWPEVGVPDQARF
jgi:4a-hydroxytetrahydrobiopterin dehydratase